MNTKAIADYITQWLDNYCDKAGTTGFTIGISGGIDSALTSILCAQTGRSVQLVTMSIRQTNEEYQRALKHIEDLKNRFSNVHSYDIELTDVFSAFENKMPFNTEEHQLSMANARSRLRMTTLYALSQAANHLVVGTGNKIEDFGIGFYTKYGDGGVDISPIADLKKTEVWSVAKELKIIPEIINAKPTDGLWSDGRSDEDQIGATYPELEWAMEFKGDENDVSSRQKEVLAIYHRLHNANKHKMLPIPVCSIPENYRK